MAIKFMDKNGNILVFDCGSPDPRNYPPSEHFPDGWTWEKVPDEEVQKHLPVYKNNEEHRGWDPPHDRIEKMKKNYETLIDVLEEKLKMPKGQLREEIKAKTKR